MNPALCTNCDAQRNDADANFCDQCGAACKGILVTRARAPFSLFGRHRSRWSAAAALVFLIFIVSVRRGWPQAAGYSGAVLVLGVIVLLNKLAFIALSTVRVFENGLEMDIPRSVDKSVFVPWNLIEEWSWNHNILRYRPRRDAYIVLRNGKWKAVWPFLYFPVELRIPENQVQVVWRLLDRHAARAHGRDNVEPPG